MLENFFSKEKIESYCVLAYEDVRETSHGIMAREDFTPRSVILFLLPYYTGETVNISRYAASLDYHLILKGIGDRLIDFLKTKYPDGHFRTYGDHSPIDERHAALIGGLGIAGENGLIISPEYGSYIFIADVVTDIPPKELLAATPQSIVLCERCGRCRAACPTGILRGEGKDCLSAITQRKGELSEDEIQLMRTCNTAWGCDLCQSSCPHNRNPKITPIEAFHQDTIYELTSEKIAAMSKDDFQKRAFSWRGRKTVERNLKLLNI